MKLLALVVTLAFPFATAEATPSIDGHYQCEECHGYLSISKATNSLHAIDLRISGGSCAGVVGAQGKFKLSAEGKFSIPWKNQGKQCVTVIQMVGDRAHVTDTCTSPEEKAGSTCAFLGWYRK